MNIQQFLRVLRARFTIFSFVVLATVVTALVVSLLLPKTYVATASLLLDNKDEQSLTNSPFPVRQQIGYMQTQVDIITSQKVALKVVRDLKLADSPGARAAFSSEAKEIPGSIEDWLATSLLRRLKVESSQSSVMQILYSANDPQFAAAVANAFAKAYMDTSLELRVEPMRQAAVWFEEQLKGGLRATLEEAQNKLTKYQKDNGIVIADERLDVENARLSELSSQALQAQNQSYDTSSRNRQARESSTRGMSPESLPEIIANPFIQGLKADLLRGESKLQEMSTQLGPNHPQILQRISENKSMREKLDAEMKKVIIGIESASRQINQKQGELQGALAAQRSKVIEQRKFRNEASVLVRDVEIAQRAYETALSRFMVNKVESDARQTNIAVLNPAVAPTAAARPRTGLNVALALIIGTLLGAATIFFMELRDRRVRSPQDLEYIENIDIPVLAKLGSWKPPRRLFHRTAATGAFLPRLT